MALHENRPGPNTGTPPPVPTTDPTPNPITEPRPTQAPINRVGNPLNDDRIPVPAG